MDDELPLITQERAHTSPIWYNRADSKPGREPRPRPPSRPAAGARGVEVPSILASAGAALTATAEGPQARRS
jgi:hypothetical protein